MPDKLFEYRYITKENPFKTCFVCLGNICRSPTGEGILQHLVNKEGLSEYIEVDSAGTGAWHVGEPANSKSRMTAEKHGIKLLSKARKFDYSDLDYFDLILAMDQDNLRDLKSLDRTKQYRHKILLLREFDPYPEDKQVPDPYYGGIQGFENVFQMVMRSSQALLDAIKPHIR